MSQKVIVISMALLLVIIIIAMVFIYFKRIKKMIKRKIEELDKQKNILESTSIMQELSKIETIIKNDKLEGKYNDWTERFEEIKENNVQQINEMIIDLDFEGEKKSFGNYFLKISQIEIEIAKAKGLTDTLLNEIKEITLSEEKYRGIIIKLKTKYRELLTTFNDHKAEYGEISEVIELQFENIEKRFKDFEEYMEKNEYDEVVHIVKAIDSMVDHIGIVVAESPDLVLLSLKLIPKRIEQINSLYEEMIKDGYPLDYLKIPYNMEQSSKNVKSIFDRIKVLNLEDCMFELKTILEYLDSVFVDFEREKNDRKKFEEDKAVFEKKLSKVNNVVSDIYNQLDEIKSLYDLKDEDITVIDDVNLKLISINKEYKSSLKKLEKQETPYSEMLNKIDLINNDLKQVDDELDVALKSLGNMYEDELRAREQLDEIQDLLNKSKVKIRNYKLPIITNEYFVELSEANEAILEVIKELERKPIVIKTLNTRVDTARDLVLKLHNTTSKNIKLAKLSEMAIVYGNRFRSSYESVDENLNQAEIMFYKGNYKRSLEITTKIIDSIESDFSKKLENIYKKEI